MSKVCSTCGVTKPLVDFQKAPGYADGHRGQCIRCIYDARNARRRAGKGDGTPAERRRQKLRKKFGLEHEDYETLSASQGGKCAICARPPETAHLFVDHDHVTGEVRGLLCGPCNSAIGLFADDTERLREAIRYIEAGI